MAETGNDLAARKNRLTGVIVVVDTATEATLDGDWEPTTWLPHDGNAPQPETAHEPPGRGRRGLK